MCLDRGGRVERTQLTWRLKQLQEEGLFEGLFRGRFSSCMRF